MPLPASNKEGEKQVRRMFMFVGLSMLLLVVAAGIAVAVNKTCGDNLPCRGTNNDDVLNERDGNGKRDRILALDGKDSVQAVTFSNDRDSLDGGKQRDRLFVNDNDGRDTAKGGKGRDTCVRDSGDGTKSCENVRTEAAGVLPEGFGETSP
jgi:hypothetical protein